MKNLVGRTINKRYRVDELLGSGGMAEVYKVLDLRRSTDLAMKMLREDLSEDAVFVRRFKKEARTLESLQHPNIVRFYGMEEDSETGLFFLLMEYVDGYTLRKEIRQARGTPLPASRILEVMVSICGALQFAHSMGMVHCDVKPANIMVDTRGRIIMTDFGIARQAEGSTTTTMATAGAPAYMAPEQVRGEEATPQTDIYALGVVLYEMLTGGERPFTGEQATITGTTGEKVRWEQVNLRPLSPRRYNPNISEELEAVVLKCLEKDPKKRFGSAQELLLTMQAVIGIFVKEEEHFETKINSGHEEQKQEIPLKHENAEYKEKSGLLGEDFLLKLSSKFFVLILGSSLFLFFICSILLINSRWINGFFIPESSMLTQTSLPLKSSTPASTHTPKATSTLELTETPEPSPTPPLKCQIVFTSYRDGNHEIYLMDQDGQNLIRLTANDANDDNPSWSPDGKKIAFDSTRDNDSEIYVMDTDGNNAYRITNSYGTDIYPIWSPDGKYIVFLSSRDGDYAFYKMKSDGTDLYRLTEKFGWNFAWSPDGSQIAYNSDRDGNEDIYVMNSDGTNHRKLTHNKANDYYPSWSPDGLQIAFTSIRDISHEIYVVNSDGSNEHRITYENKLLNNPDWSPSGKKFVVESEEGNDGFIYSLDVTGDNLIKINSVEAVGFHPKWSPHCNY